MNKSINQFTNKSNQSLNHQINQFINQLNHQINQSRGKATSSPQPIKMKSIQQLRRKQKQHNTKVPF